MPEARMASNKSNRLLLFLLICCAAVLFTSGIDWGLPSRKADPFLFGDRPAWTGQEILALAPGWGDDASRAADVAAHPLANRDQPIIVNQTDSQRAAIVRRYRLYSDQPDEMITLRALAQMKPGKLQFDPKLYQYGGLWIYPIGAILKIASLVHLVRLTPDLAFYLDHPEAFGRLYVVMRLYSVAWGLVGVGVIFSLAMRIGASQIIAATAAILYTLLPTVINGAHEAKPHLAGAVLALIAIDLALRAAKSGERKWAIGAGIACGAAGGMVLSGWLAVGVLPAMGSLMAGRAAESGRVLQRGDRYAGIVTGIVTGMLAVLAAVVVYAIFNPYVIIHLLGDRAVLQSNLENSAAMYQVPASMNGIFHGILLLAYGGSGVVFMGMFAVVLQARLGKPLAWLLLAGIVPGLCVFLMRATGKPGEYARFALPVDVLSVVGVAMGMNLLRHQGERVAMGVVLILLLLPFGVPYVLTYGRETFGGSTRLIVSERLRQLSSTGASAGASVLAVGAEPAPYTLPPVDMFQWKIELLPPKTSGPADADVRIDAVDQVGRDRDNVQYLVRPLFLPAFISWAGKPFRIETRVVRRSGDDSAAKGQR